MKARAARHILLVNDEPVQRYRLASVLKKAGYEVAVAEDGLKAIELVSEKKSFDLLITDLYMPRVDGWGLCRFIFENNFNLPVLIISSYFAPEEIEDIVKALGVEGYLKYPCSSKKLLSEIKRIFERERQKTKEAYHVFMLGTNSDNNWLRTLRQAGFQVTFLSSLKETLRVVRENNFSAGFISTSFSPEEAFIIKQESPHLSLFLLPEENYKGDPFAYVIKGARYVLPKESGPEYIRYLVEKELKEKALLYGQELLHQKTKELEAVSQELVRIQNILQLIVEQASDIGIIITNEKMEPIFSNPKAEEFFELAKSKDFYGLMSFLIGRFNPELVKKIVEQEGVFHCEVKLSETSQILSLKVRSFHQKEKDTLLGYVFSIEDLTKERQFQERLVQMQKMEAIATMAAGIAHDFNNILAAIRLKAELLTERVFSSDAKYVNDILSLCDRAAGIVKQMISFSHPERKGSSNVSELNNQVREALTFLQETIPDGIGVKLNLLESELYVPLDPSQLTQIIMNLCLNAVQAMGEKGILALRTYRTSLPDEKLDGYIPGGIVPKRGSFAVLEVSDTGTGIAPEDLRRIFDPYFSTKNPESGTGLGLAVTRRIIENAGGFILVKTAMGKGSTFRVYLPQVSPPRKTLGQDLKKKLLKKSFSTVMVVEDEKGIAEAIANFLKEKGYNVICCFSGEEAISKLEEGITPGVLVVDLNLPGVPGRRVIEAAKQKKKDLPILVTTGFLSPYDLEFLKRMAITHIIQKPFRLEEIQKNIAVMMDN
ncbi:ATP-binding response regulator [Thermodesulfatator atlanticus]|uniref:ATP-binding response regulator n=1 Tax=Thermodesulfatator atlanticus TaxID=501497 RepID=UPI0003B6B39D|nr:response regulator [Thermodesulfatator atlanticus]